MPLQKELLCSRNIKITFYAFSVNAFLCIRMNTLNAYSLLDIGVLLAIMCVAECGTEIAEAGQTTNAFLY